MRYEYKHLLKSSKKNFFISIYLLIRYFFFKKYYNKKIKIRNLQSNYQEIIRNQLRIKEDWFSHNINTLDLFFTKNNFYNKKIKMLEIGSYEGNSSVFFLKYFPNLELTCVDTFEGSVKQEKDKTIVEDDFQLICFDIVSEPSTPGAYLANSQGKTSVQMDPSINVYLNETKDNKIDNLINSILRD